MTPLLTVQTSTCAGYTLSTDVARLVALWTRQYELARRHGDPLTAVVSATLSTAETWEKLR